MVLDDEGNVWASARFSTDVVSSQLNANGGPNTATICVSEIVPSNGQAEIALFAVENGTNSLWITKVEQTTIPNSDNWTNLGSLAEAIAVPSVVQGGPEVYLADPLLNIYHFAKNPTDGVWASRKLAAPADPSDSNSTPNPISAIMMHATVLDENGNAMPNAEISVTSDQWATILVNEFTYMPGPGAPISVQADSSGKARRGA